MDTPTSGRHPRDALYAVNSPIAIGVKQPAGRLPGIRPHNNALPRLPLDSPQMFLARPVLRENRHGQCREQLQILGTARLLRSADFVAGPDRAHGPLALPDETRPRVPAHNAELPHLLVLRARTAYAAVTQVEAQQVRVVSMRLREHSPISASGTLGSQAGAPGRILAPFTQRRPVDSGRHANASQAAPDCHQRERITPHSIAVHSCIVAAATDKTTDAQRLYSHGAPGGIRTHTTCCLRASTLPLVYRGVTHHGGSGLITIYWITVPSWGEPEPVARRDRRG